MNLSINYSKDDPRWAACGERHVKNGLVPNWYISILYEYNEYINDLANINVAVETGTYTGQTTEYFANHFNTVHTVELNPTTGNHYGGGDFVPIYEKLNAKHPNITFWTGNTVDVLPEILEDEKDERILFLLDAHDGDSSTPVREELQAIKDISNRNDHVIIIDDCVCLGRPNWPSVSELNSLLLDINENFTIQNTGHARDIYIAYERK